MLSSVCALGQARPCSDRPRASLAQLCDCLYPGVSQLGMGEAILLEGTWLIGLARREAVGKVPQMTLVTL